MKNTLKQLFNHHYLSQNQAYELLKQISENTYDQAELAAFVSVFLMRSIHIDELLGFRQALLDMAKPVDLGTQDLVDIVGTGGDNKNTFNISTCACFVVAGVGQKVAKHGNYGVSSVSGSSNVLEELGVVFRDNSADLKADLAKANICFLHAPLFHPALKSVASTRKSLSVRTFFNLLGPLVNPAQPLFLSIGVYNLEVARLYQYVFQKRKQNFLILHSLDGYDEVSLTQDCKIMNPKGEFVFSPEELGFQTCAQEDLYGGDTKIDAKNLFLNILNGKGTKAQNNVVICNAALALEQTHKFGNYTQCVERATQSLMQGMALESLQKLIENT